MDLFGRVKSTDQAEMIATVLYAYDQLAGERKGISDKDVYDYVLDWKDEKEYELCDAIHDMAILELMDVEFSNQLMETDL